MKKDLQSYEKHNSQYITETNSYSSTLEIIKKYDTLNQFKITGFDIAIKLSNPLPTVAIDIGSGTGWLVQKLSTFFKKVIALEPSYAATEVSKQINKDFENIEFVVKEAVDFFKDRNFSDPVFITTSVVLNHIEDYHVKNLLHLIDKLPEKSRLFFDERYDKNTNWNMWHVRNKDWWRENLPSWQLIFLDISNSGYRSGIYGIRVADEQKVETKSDNIIEKIIWKVSYFYNIAYRVYKKIWRIIKK